LSGYTIGDSRIAVDPYAFNWTAHWAGCSRFNNDAFVWIPKNASSTLRFLFPDGNACFHDFDVETYWVILRDPILRWKSGVIEYISFCSSSKVNPTDVKGRLEWVLDNIDQIEFDEHTASQTSFLKYTGNTRYIDMKKNFWVHKLINELGLPHKPEFGGQLKMNTTSGNRYKEEIKHSIDSVMSTAFENRLREYYSEDFKLIEQVI
jgi:hypothetical protein